MTTALSTRPDGFSHLAQAVIMQMEPDFDESCSDWLEVASRAADEDTPLEQLWRRAVVATAIDLAMQIVAAEAWQLQEQTDWCNERGIDRMTAEGDSLSSQPLDPHWEHVAIWLTGLRK